MPDLDFQGQSGLNTGNTLSGGTADSVVYVDTSGQLAADGVLNIYGDNTDTNPFVGIVIDGEPTATEAFAVFAGTTTPISTDGFAGNIIQLVAGGDFSTSGVTGSTISLQSNGLTQADSELVGQFIAITGSASDVADTSIYGLNVSAQSNAGNASMSGIRVTDINDVLSEILYVVGDGDIRYVNISGNQGEMLFQNFNLASGDSDGGSVRFISGDASGNANGGNFIVEVGAGSGTGSDGAFQVKSEAAAIIFDVTEANGLQVGRSGASKTVFFAEETDNGNSGTADTINWNNGNKQKSTVTDDVTYTFTAPAGPCNLTLRLVVGASPPHTITWPATVKWPGGTAPTLSTTENDVDVISFYYDGTNYYGDFSQDFS